jgi:hypothetical protein
MGIYLPDEVDIQITWTTISERFLHLLLRVILAINREPVRIFGTGYVGGSECEGSTGEVCIQNLDLCVEFVVAKGGQVGSVW